LTFPLCDDGENAFCDEEEVDAHEPTQSLVDGRRIMAPMVIGAAVVMTVVVVGTVRVGVRGYGLN